jgi:hypothetical protein
VNRRQAYGEFIVFLAAAVAGIVGVGEASRGAAAWLFVTAAATIVVVRQMGRVQDRWPQRPRDHRRSTSRWRTRASMKASQLKEHR